MSTIRDSIKAESNEDFVIILRMIRMKLDGIAAQVAVQDQFVELDADLAGWINKYGGHMNYELPADPPWLALVCLGLIDMDLKGFIAYDKRLAEPIWGPPNTISFRLGALEAKGDATAKAMCKVLSEILGDGHCAKAYDNGQGD